jgi:DNA invertase Pin-like site-specific DNA recombinase
MQNLHETKKRAAAYIRVSTEDQTEYSPDAQRRALLKYAEDNGYEIPESGFYIDEGISGRNAEKRPAFMRMISHAKSAGRPYDAILVHKFDRFARSREDSVVFKSLLKRECGVRVISITESIEDDKFSLILEAMLEAMAEFYSINLAEEVKKGMTEKHLRGGFQASPAFGYAVRGNALVPVHQEAETVREIFRLFNEGCGYYQIACRLNMQGLRTRRGNPFESRAVEYIIRNPVYIGRLRWNPSGRSCRDYENENIIIVNAGHKPIVDIEEWDNAQRRAVDLKSQRVKYQKPADTAKDWLTGLIRCPLCGSVIVFCGKNRMRCSGYARAKCSRTQSADSEMLREAIIHRLRLDTGESYPVLHRFPVQSRVGAKSELKARLLKVNRKIERLREAYLCGAETAEEYKAEKETLTAEKERIAAKMSMSASENEPRLSSMIASALEDITFVLTSPNLPAERKYEAAHSAIETILWDKDENTLTIRYRIYE